MELSKRTIENLLIILIVSIVILMIIGVFRANGDSINSRECDTVWQGYYNSNTKLCRTKGGAVVMDYNNQNLGKGE